MTLLRTATTILLLFTFVASVPLDRGVGKFSKELLSDEVRNALQTGTVGSVLREVAQELDLANMMLEMTQMESSDDPRAVVFCATCSAGIDEVVHAVHNGTDPVIIIGMLTNLCVELHIGNFIFCEGYLWLIEPQLFWIFESMPDLTGKDFCAMSFPSYGCETDNPDRVWEVTLPDVPKPPVTDPVWPEPGSPVMKVLHLADTHYDPYYLPGSNAECGEKLYCCREESGPVETPEAAAGKWGDYRRCDAPKWLLQALYDHVNANYQDLDFILWTGDLIPHNIWNTTREGNLDIIRESVQMIKDNFPHVPVFPAIGNHESTPVNMFPQPYIDNEFDISWLYDEIVTLWETWLPLEVATSIAYTGCYSTLIKPGLRILSINSNYGYSFNWWTVYDDVDPGEELQWMAQELQLAEDAGEKVYIISHHPSGHHDCLPTWSHQYNKIAHRYESTIAGFFYGHTHNDQFTIFYDPDDPQRPYHIGYTAQSQTPYAKLNPGYKVYVIDGEYQGSSFRVLDTENWIMDLDYANANDDPQFSLLYTAKDAYGMDDLSPASWNSLVEEMKVPNSTTFDLFYKHFTKDARPHREEGCNKRCKENTLCSLVTSDTSDTSHCDGL